MCMHMKDSFPKTARMEIRRCCWRHAALEPLKSTYAKGMQFKSACLHVRRHQTNIKPAQCDFCATGRECIRESVSTLCCYATRKKVQRNNTRAINFRAGGVRPCGKTGLRLHSRHRELSTEHIQHVSPH